MYSVDDDIAAIASAPGGSARGVIRMSGPSVVVRLADCFTADDGQPIGTIAAPSQRRGNLRIVLDSRGGAATLPGRLLVWPTARSYTRQPSAEFHTLGSPPLLAAGLAALGQVGIRVAQPGEFTLRAFLAGRIDLTQAEAVLGVIDAADRASLDAALDQIAGGLSRPLQEARQQLLATLAELEAGLDFVEEDIEFISRAELLRRLEQAHRVVKQTERQLVGRGRRDGAWRVALVGPPNAGKSSLFNALTARYGSGSEPATSIVSAEPGATRDAVAAMLQLGGLQVELMDTAGEEPCLDSSLGLAVEKLAAAYRQAADLRAHCFDASRAPATVPSTEDLTACSLRVGLKADLVPPASSPQAQDRFLICSSATGRGLDAVARAIADRLSAINRETAAGGVCEATAQRCTESLRHAAAALHGAMERAAFGEEELVAAELRHALDGLGQVVGAVHTEDVLDRIFSQFCIGK